MAYKKTSKRIPKDIWEDMGEKAQNYIKRQNAKKAKAAKERAKMNGLVKAIASKIKSTKTCRKRF